MKKYTAFSTSHLLTLINIVFCVLLTGCVTTYAHRPQVQQFIQQMAVQHNFDQKQLTQLFDRVSPDPRILQTMTKPREGMLWYRYRALFLTPKRIQEGADFWRQHAAELAYAQRRYGVSSQIIVAILGVETNYGQFQGTYSVLDSLSTLAFDYPPRATYFRSELEQYLLLTREAPFDPSTVLGSYAGAIGAAQFMPSSYRRYAVDSTGKGYSDLIGNNNDAILSVANYFKAYGWKLGQPVATPAFIVGDRYRNLLQSDKHEFTIAQFRRYGIYSKYNFPPRSRAYLITLQDENRPEYWLVFPNFQVIMGYNASQQYAMAVYQLSEQIRALYQQK